MRKKIKTRLKFWNTNAQLKKLAGSKDYNAKIIQIQTLSKFFKKNIRVIRPGFGIHPFYFEKLINRKSPRNIINRKSPRNIRSQTPLKRILLKPLRLSL